MMNSGLSPKTHFLIVTGIAVLGFVFLVSRPKTVVKDEEAKAVTSTAEEAPVHMSNPAADRLAKEIRDRHATDANPLNAYRALAEMFFQESVFDSSAYYFEQIAIANPGVSNWLRAGDAYLQAYSLALNPAKIEDLAAKTRDAYSQALKFDPASLHAKTNSALTYVNSATPMRAISILREVLDQQPNYLPAVLALGKLSMQSGQFDKAVDRFKEVLKIDKDNIEGKMGLAYSYIELGKTNDAKVLLQEILDADIDPIVKDEVRKTLNNLK
ncbi:tetratricopeptide repeat protein [Leadbetterella byssophila]|uniref:Tetratricopeptide domain protein n=1 Tax=Leadbetterella byssophila (strain DSM 17132 / JCM 16389 / KACC 11308 / NBRC 106382 / 4M15) TaxID=649349 RepID=E4RSL4_LEAB4|nr:tetratricopeptide repeat protein [Leadbetterella byssophila]ADQ18584.1 tetratricopeptide domain protein [Leadbetterella byssophila DSM 17132]